jgi:hypothetical protein
MFERKQPHLMKRDAFDLGRGRVGFGITRRLPLLAEVDKAEECRRGLRPQSGRYLTHQMDRVLHDSRLDLLLLALRAETPSLCLIPNTAGELATVARLQVSGFDGFADKR